MGNPAVGRNVRIEVSKTEAAAKTVTALTLANPGVATSAGHGLSDGAVGYMNDVTGMVNLEGQAVRVNSPATDTFQLENINTTNYAVFTGGEFVPITAWATLSRAASYSIGGGSADKLDNTVLLDALKQEVNGLLAAQTCDINLKMETVDDEALGLITTAALNQAYLVFRITLADGAQRIFRGQPSMPGEDMQQGAIATGSISVTIKGQVVKLPA